MTNDDRDARTAEEIVAAQWTYLLRDAAELIRPDAVRAAHAQERLRLLFPAVSHGTLFFSTTTELPYTRVGGTVYYQGNGTFLAMGAPGTGRLGETGTLEEAFALLAEDLPADVGPVVRGPGEIIR